MSNLVQFLENLGRDASLRHAPPAQLYSAMNKARIDANAQWAVLRGDLSRLATVLRARQNMVCLIMAPQAHAAESQETAQRLACVG